MPSATVLDQDYPRTRPGDHRGSRFGSLLDGTAYDGRQARPRCERLLAWPAPIDLMT